jgi:hypothetical protein
LKLAGRQHSGAAFVHFLKQQANYQTSTPINVSEQLLLSVCLSALTQARQHPIRHASTPAPCQAHKLASTLSGSHKLSIWANCHRNYFQFLDLKKTCLFHQSTPKLFVGCLLVTGALFWYNFVRSVAGQFISCLFALG